MQVNMFTQNSINVVVGRASQEKRQLAQTPGSAFDVPQCKVTISKEGRKLSRQEQDRHVEKSAQSLKVEKMMLRQQEQSKQADETQSEYLSLIEEIDKVIKSMQNSNMAGADDVTMEKKQQVIRQMREQKQKQLEENQKKAKEAQQMAMQTSEMQEEIDQNNRDLLVMLRSIEESEKAKEEREGDNAEEGGGSSGGQSEKSISDIISNSATQFATSSMKREMSVVGMINGLQEEGLWNLAQADEIAQKAYSEAESLKELINDEDTTDEEKREAVISYGLKMAPKAYDELVILLGSEYTKEEKEAALDRYRGMVKYDSDFSDYRRRGLQMVRDAKECRQKHIADNPLQGMEETAESMIQSAVDAAFNSATQGKLDETSQELEDEVKDLIDERNDIDQVEPEEEKDEEEEKEIGELLEPKEQPEQYEEDLKEGDEEQVNVTQG